ncbi:L-arabinose isomerase [Cerasicoccus fimbriatus]|uniref:L-arabinose isomerase n=1 Tax=Cerasicoccus fimbriatus TaxID=3014554 RepID=UPI0022B52880|nr:L-arabinose isomerase [Cerasicoccus sp. TK19100]
MSTKQVWFVTGSQHLYGPETLKQVAANAEEIAKALNADASIPVEIVFKPIVTTPSEIRSTLAAASSEASCIGVITWMHTFSPAKMWISGLNALTKPICHLHTQFNRDIPWDIIDMDFMNLNQSAHGGREYGHMLTRMRIPRKVIVGHWEASSVRNQLAKWAGVALGWDEMRNLKIVRFGDNMRYVSVTCGDKVEAERVFGFEVNTHAVGDLVAVINEGADAEIDNVCQEYADLYDLAPELAKGGARHDSLREAARIEIGLRRFLVDGGYGAFSDTFEDLHGMVQLPGLPVQRLMSDGYGFAGEGDWKHAMLVRVLKAMTPGMSGGTSFMEDYTYHFDPAGARCLGSHMLEICPSISATKPRVEIHPLGIGGKADPVRLVFNGSTGSAINVSLVDLGNRFRFLVNEVESVEIPHEMPKLPVARVLWDAKPNLATAAEAWIQAGGAHHTAFSFDVTADQIEMLAEISGVECVFIDEATEMRRFKQDLRTGEVYYGIRGI